MSATRIKIQPVVVDGVKTYRATPEASNDYQHETKPDETLDEFRYRLIDKYEGCIFLFQPTWKPLKGVRI